MAKAKPSAFSADPVTPFSPDPAPRGHEPDPVTETATDVDPVPDPLPAASAAPRGPLVPVEQPDGSIIGRALDPGADNQPGNRTVRIGGVRYEHVRDTPEGAWIYRQG